MLPSMPGPYTRFRDDRVRGVAPYPQRHDLSQFRVAGYDNELLAFTEPVEVWCTRCGTSRWLGDFAATVRNCGAALDEVVTWAKGHACSLLRLALSAAVPDGPGLPGHHACGVPGDRQPGRVPRVSPGP